MTLKPFGWKLSPEMCYLIEAIKTEGYLSLKHQEASITNKDIGLIKYIENILIKNKVHPKKRFVIKIKPEDQRFLKDDIKIFLGKKELKFRIRYGAFDNLKNIVLNLPFRKSIKFKLQFKGKIHTIKISVLKNKINIKSNISTRVYTDLRFWGTKFLKFLKANSCGITTHEIRLNKIIFNSPELAAACFSALIDCEGNFSCYRLFRRIRIRMTNLEYLKDWQILLNIYKIKSDIRKTGNLHCLTIEGFEDFQRLSKLGVKFFHSEKSLKWDEMLKSYKRHQISRNSYKEYYLNLFKNLEKPITSEELSKMINKSRGVVHHHLFRLEKENLISSKKIGKSHFYSLNRS